MALITPCTHMCVNGRDMGARFLVPAFIWCVLWQMEILEAALEQFYESRRLQSGATLHACSSQGKNLLLLHILVLAVILEGYHMDSTAVEGLKKALQMKPALLTSAFK